MGSEGMGSGSGGEDPVDMGSGSGSGGEDPVTMGPGSGSEDPVDMGSGSGGEDPVTMGPGSGSGSGSGALCPEKELMKDCDIDCVGAQPDPMNLLQYFEASESNGVFKTTWTIFADNPALEIKLNCPGAPSEMVTQCKEGGWTVPQEIKDICGSIGSGDGMMDHGSSSGTTDDGMMDHGSGDDGMMDHGSSSGSEDDGMMDHGNSSGSADDGMMDHGSSSGSEDDGMMDHGSSSGSGDGGMGDHGSSDGGMGDHSDG